MSSGTTIPSVTTLCKTHPDLLSINRAEQIEDLSSITDADLSTAQAFYSRNHVTQGMREFLGGAIKRLNGKSEQAVFELRQAMGGGKTHNMIALGLLAQFPELGKLLPEEITAGMEMNQARIATVSGRKVKKYIWGDIAIQLNREDDFRQHWIDGPEDMNEDDWVEMIGDQPTLIMLDELPPYLAKTHTKPVAEGTLFDLMKFSLGTLFTAAMKCPRCVVVVASLDATYNEVRKELGVLLADIKSEINRGAKSITPVDLGTGEIYDILRKRLFTEIPASNSPEVERIVRAYRETYREGIKAKALDQSAEHMADEIPESYPFHPGYKDILALFKENERFRQTRGLIQFTANLMRGIWDHKDRDIHLIGAQHLDFSIQDTRDQVREIERALESALASDIFDADGSSHAQVIDRNAETHAASETAALLFVSSLSDNTDEIRGLPYNALIEYLVAPGRSPVQFIKAFKALKARCWYLHNPDGDRWCFSDIANVRKQIEDKISNIPQDDVDREMRRRLEDIFQPVNRHAYSELKVLPSIDDVNLTPSKRTCLVLSPDAKFPPERAAAVFENAVYKNAFCVVTSDGSKMAEAENHIRRIIAIEAVRETIPDISRHRQKIKNELDIAKNNFNTSVISLFNTIWFPTIRKLMSVRINIGHDQEKGVIQGEMAVEKALSGSDAMKLDTLDPENPDRLISRCEEMLFPDRQSRTRWSDILERAASNTRWVWLQPKGMEVLKAAALASGRWVEKDGYVDHSPPPPQPAIRVNKIGGDETIGESKLEFAISDAGENPEVLISATRDDLESGEITRDETWITTEVELWFQVRNPDTGEISEPYQWTGSIKITHEPRDITGQWHVTLDSVPEAELRWNTSGINRKEGTIYDGSPIEIDGTEKITIYVYALKGNVSAQRDFTLDAIGAERTIDKNQPARVRQHFQFTSREEISRVIRVLKDNKDIRVYKPKITAGEGDCSILARSDDDMAYAGENIEAIIEGLRNGIGQPDAAIKLQFRQIDFPNGFIMGDFTRGTDIEISIDNVEQGF